MRTYLVCVLAGFACTRPNPGYLQTGSGTSGSTSDSETTTEAPTSVAPTSSSSDGSSSTLPTDATTSDTSDTSTSDTSDTTTDPTDPTDVTTADPSETSDTTDSGDTDTETDTDDPGEPPTCNVNPLTMNCQHEYLAGSWFLFCQDQLEWSVAVDKCTAMCATLASIVSDEENNAVHNRLLDPEYVPSVTPIPDEQSLQPNASRWIGGYLQQGIFGWVDGSSTAYTHWGPEEPDGSGPCVALAVVGKDTGDGFWYDRDCAVTPYPFICKYIE